MVIPLRSVGIAILCAASATTLKYLLQPAIQHESPFVLYYGAVILAAWYGGLTSGVLATLLSAIATEALFMQPGGAAALADRGQMLRLLIFLVEGTFISVLAGRLHAARAHSSVADQRRHELDESFRLLVSTVQDYAMFILDREGHVTSWNAGAQRIKGYKPEEIIGRHFSAFYSPEDVAAGRPAWALAQAEQKGHFEDEGWRLRKDGTRFWANVVITALRDANGDLRGFSKVTRDVTERRALLEREHEARLAAEAAAREAAEALARAQEASRAKDEFLMTLSHELRTPLTSILGWTALMRHREFGVPPAEALDAVEHSAQIQARLVEDMLDMARSSAGKLQLEVVETDLALAARRAVDSMRAAAEAKGIRLRLHCRSEPVPLRADPARLQQILWNLVSNAVKFTPRGGEVTVTVYATEEDAVAVVRDTGIGMASDFIPRAFDRFTQADGSTTRSSGGLGIGLAITRELVELHGGHVHASSAGPDRGTTMTVTLPLLPQDAIIAPPARGSYPNLAGKTVLVVEDDRNARRVLAALVTECGATAIEAASVDEALARWEADKPNVILADIAMSGKDGFELIRRVRERDVQTPAIAVTAIHTGNDDREALLAAGFDDFRRKPFSPQELAWAIAEARGQA